MNKILTLAMVLALGAGAASATTCRDASGKFAKCPPAVSTAKKPECRVGVSIPCGNSCISKNKICRKP